jgi:iron complex outermembrane receptor protein
MRPIIMRNMNLAIGGLVATAIGLPLGALAQEDNDSPFEEITVTATKREESIYEVPVAMSAFSAATIEKQGITDLMDVGKFVPNLNVTAFSAGHTSSANPFIRGIGLQDHLITTDPGVSVYVDGVYLGRQVGQNWSLINIERIEVLRGPQGTLYGRNSIGGAINIITRAPGDENGGRVGLQLGSRGRANADFYADMTLTDTLAMSVTGGFKRRDGIGSFLNIPNAEADVGELQDISARVDILWNPTEDFSLRLTADGNEGSNGLRPYDTLIDIVPNGGVYLAGYRDSDVAANPYDNNTGQVSQTRVTNEARGISVTADYSINDNLSAKFIFSDRTSEYESGLDDDGFFDDFLSFPEIGTAEQTSTELQLNGEYGPWDFITGVYYFEESGANDQNPTVFLGGPGDFLLGQDVDSVAVYGNVGYAISDELRVSAGIRHTSDEKTATININSGLIDTSATRDWSETSWELALSYDLNENLTTYGTIQNGYQSGQFPARPYCLFGALDFTQPGNVSQPNCFVANENITAINYEAGIKGTPLPNLQLSAAIFLTDYSDLPYQVSTTAGAGFNTVNLIVDQQSTGLELEGAWAITDEFMLYGSLGLINVDVDNPDAVAPLTPEMTLSLSPEYTQELSNGGTITYRADYSFRDDMYGEPSALPGRFTSIDSRSLVNVDISYAAPDDSWTVGFYGRNITDERYSNAKLNLTDYILDILSNDASEFGIRYVNNF